MFWKAAGMFGILVAGILIGAFGPTIFQHRLDTSWHELRTKGPAFGFSYDTSVIFSDLPLPTIRSVSGRAKFLNSIGPGGATPLGYVVTVEMAPLAMSKVPERYKREKSEKINGVPVTYSALSDKAYYEIAFNFDLKDKDVVYSENCPRQANRRTRIRHKECFPSRGG